jgi:polyisoprenyl-phosphate glycosyltransferase
MIFLGLMKMSENNDTLIIEIDSILIQDNHFNRIVNNSIHVSIKNASSKGCKPKIFSIRSPESCIEESNNNELISQSTAEAWLSENNIDYDELIIGQLRDGYKVLSVEEFVFKYSGPYWNKTINIVIPFFNEEGNISVSHQEHKKVERFFNVTKYIYIDNGSSDNTYKNLKKVSLKDSKVKIISIKNNLGYGYGIKSGLQESNADLVLINHADLQFKPDLFFKNNLLSLITLKKPMGILPKRINRPIIDRINSAFLRFLISIVYFYKVTDFNGQPKLFSVNEIKDLDSLPNNFCIDLALFRIFKDQSIVLPSVQIERYSGKSSWNEDFVKRITIFVEYLSYAIKKRNK